MFLMHRVELKAADLWLAPFAYGHVPNAPCGVERPSRLSLTLAKPTVFLMHRVELKGLQV